MTHLVYRRGSSGYTIFIGHGTAEHVDTDRIILANEGLRAPLHKYYAEEGYVWVAVDEATARAFDEADETLTQARARFDAITRQYEPKPKQRTRR